MSSYAFWNNKGGVGKSFLCFVACCEFAERNPNTDIYVIDLCPQGNVSETLLGGQTKGAKNLTGLAQRNPRATIGGYLEARLSSPFLPLDDVTPYVTSPCKYNSSIPKNIKLIGGDNFVELLSEPIRQASQLSLPLDAWRKVIGWVDDLVRHLESNARPKDSVFFIDCNPSFSVYTQQALIAADHLVIPFTPDESSRRGVENVAALLYGVTSKGDEGIYAKLSFAGRADEQGVRLPKLKHFLNNRVMYYEGKPSRAFSAASKAIKRTVDDVFRKRKSIFDGRNLPSDSFLDIPDNHSANIVCALTGTPLSKLKAGPHTIEGERIQVNAEPLTRYKSALSQFVSRL